jgi:hypothetical protein
VKFAIVAKRKYQSFLLFPAAFSASQNFTIKAHESRQPYYLTLGYNGRLSCGASAFGKSEPQKVVVEFYYKEKCN